MIILAPVNEDAPALEVGFHPFQDGFALLALRQNKLWEDLLTKARRWITNDRDGKTSFAIGKSYDPVSCP